MTITRLLALLCLIPAALRATPPDSLWLRTFDNGSWDWCYAGWQSEDGGFVLAGNKDTPNGYDAWLIKTDVDGNLVWDRTHGGSDWDIWFAANPTADGGYILAGTTESFGNGSPGLMDAWLMKADANGDSVWSRTFGSATAHDGWMAVQQTADGGYICGGWTSSWGAGAADMCLFKVSAEGDSLWYRTYGTGWGDFIYGLRQTPDGGFIIGGETEAGPFGGEDIWIIKTDSLGNREWQQFFGTEFKDVCEAVDVGPDGSLFFAGHVHSIDAQIPSDFWVAKLTAEGDTMWTRRFGDESHYEIIKAVQATADGGCLVAGNRNYYVPPDVRPAKYWLGRLDAQGDTLWTREWGGGTSVGCTALDQIEGDTIMLAGYYYSYPGYPNYDFALMKVGPRPNDAENSLPLPEEFTFNPAYPNPFNPSTTISFSLPRTSPVTLSVFNTLGQRVREVSLGQLSAGEHRYVFDGSGLPSGVYLAQMEAAGRSQMQKMVLLK